MDYLPLSLKDHIKGSFLTKEMFKKVFIKGKGQYTDHQCKCWTCPKPQSKYKQNSSSFNEQTKGGITGWQM